MKIGYCLTGSFCTFDKAIKVIEELVNKGHEVTPIMSENAYNTDTRFAKAIDIQNKLIEITGNSIIHTIEKAEPIGPKKMFDVLAVSSLHIKHSCEACKRYSRYNCYYGCKKSFKKQQSRCNRCFNQRCARRSGKKYRCTFKL